jgi:lipopolysaccharide transport system ATP-binding protein
MKPLEQFWALRDVSFSVPVGRMVGVVGANGSGKSTLLRLIGGVGRLDGGSVKVHGRIGALLELGAGFHPDLTGRENAIVTGVFSGLTRQQVVERFDSIVAFAELEKFISNPLRTYSTGMQMRLAFAIAVHAEPEILLIDEVLSVGDLSFQRKCLDRIAQFKTAGCSILLVSHEASLVRELCDQALWLSSGRLMAYGAADDVVRQYVGETESEGKRILETEEPLREPAAPQDLRATPQPTFRTSLGTELIVNENRFGSLEMEITAVRLLDGQGGAATELASGQSLRVEIDYLAPLRVVAPIFQVQISREDELVCYDLNTETTELKVSAVQGEGQLALCIERLDLNSGRYYVDVGCYAQNWAYAFDYHSNVYPLAIQGAGPKEAVLNAPHRWEIWGGKAIHEGHLDLKGS